MENQESSLIALKGCFYGSKSPYRVNHRFSIDATDHAYLVSSRGGCKVLDKGSQSCTNAKWKLKDDARDVICERLVSLPLLRVIFGPTQEAPVEVFWFLHYYCVIIADVKKGLMKQITRVHPNNHRQDGVVLVAPNSADQTHGSLSYASSFVRLNRPAFVIQEDDGTFRLLDLETWTLSTITSLSRSSADDIRLYPGLGSQLTFPFVPSDDHILVELTTGVGHLDLAKGKLLLGPKYSTPGQTYQYCLPIPSSRGESAYILRYRDHSELLRMSNGKTVSTPIPLALGHCAAYVASTDCAILAVADPKSKTEHVWKLASPTWTECDLTSSHFPAADLTSLLNCAHFANDITIQHKSNTWKMQSGIVRELHPRLNFKKLTTLIEPFETDSVEAFIASLFGKPLDIADTIESCRIWAHAAYLWRELDIGENLPLFTFIATVLPQLSESTLCALLSDIWNDTTTNWTQSDPIIEVVARQVKERCFNKFMDLLMSQPSSRNMLLAFTMSSLVKSETVALEATIPKARGLKTILIEPGLHCSAQNAKFLLRTPNDFVFLLPSATHPYAMVGDMRYLYARWNWFKRLMDIGGVEKKNRIAEMPSWMTRPCLTALLTFVHTISFLQVLAVADAEVLLEHSRELEIVDADGVPVPTFGALYSICMGLLFPVVSEENILAQIARSHHIGMLKKRDELMMLVVSESYQFDAMSLIDQLPSEVLLLLKQERQNLIQWMEDDLNGVRV